MNILDIAFASLIFSMTLVVLAAGYFAVYCFYRNIKENYGDK